MFQGNNVEILGVKRFLTHAMAKLDGNTVYNLVKKGLEQGLDAFEMIEDARAGMEKVGDLYEEGKYFLGDLMVAADIFLEVLDIVFKVKGFEPPSDLPPVVFGTVGGDIHDIGKNITIGVFKSKGYQVCDLGVDVSAEAFLEAVRQTSTPLLCLSGLITTAYDSMKRTVDLLVNEGLRSKVTVVIGGLINENIKLFTGADYWVTDCAKGAELCNRIMLNHRQLGAAGF